MIFGQLCQLSLNKIIVLKLNKRLFGKKEKGQVAPIKPLMRRVEADYEIFELELTFRFIIKTLLVLVSEISSVLDKFLGKFKAELSVSEHYSYGSPHAF